MEYYRILEVCDTSALTKGTPCTHFNGTILERGRSTQYLYTTFKYQPTIKTAKIGVRIVLLRFSFFLNLFFFLLCSLSSSETASGGSWWCPSCGGDGSPVRYSPGNLVGLISSELGVRGTPLWCSAPRRCSAGLLLGGRKHSVIALPLSYWLITASCPAVGYTIGWLHLLPRHPTWENKLNVKNQFYAYNILVQLNYIEIQQTTFKQTAATYLNKNHLNRTQLTTDHRCSRWSIPEQHSF